MTTNEIFTTMVEWIVDNTEMRNPTEALRKAGLDAANYSKIKSGTNKSVKYETMLKLNNAFGKPFNPEWMRGKSDVMLSDGIAPLCSGKQPKPTDMVKSLLAEKDARIADLKHQLAGTMADKDKIIAAQKRELAAKDALIENLQQTISSLRADLAVEKGLSTGHSPSASAESEHSRPTV